MIIIKQWLPIGLFALGLGSSSGALAQSSCVSVATLKISASGYSGPFTIELRRGTRPGSRVVGTRTMVGGGEAVFTNVCPGTLFYAFGTTESDQVSVTRYFDVTNDGRSYTNPTITVFYSSQGSEGNTVGSAKKDDL